MTVFERDDRIGGLLRYGIPEFKMEKRHIDRRLEQMAAEGTQFRPGSTSASTSPPQQLRAEFDAVVLAGGATASRDLPIPGRELDGIHQAMEYLPWANRVQNGDPVLDDDGAAADHAPRARRSSSSAAATPAPTAWAPRTGRARQACTSSRSCPARRSPAPTRRRGRPTR